MRIILLGTIAVFCAVLVDGEIGRAQPDPRIERWEETIAKFESIEAKEPSPKGAVLLVGGSNARRWTDVDAYLPKHRMINRGFGGARLTEVLHFADRIIFPYKPRVIVVNAGGNDLGAGASPAQIGKSASSLIDAIRAQLPNTRIFFIGLPIVKRAIGNPESKAAIEAMNDELDQLAENTEQVEFIDLVPDFSGDSVEFRPDLFVEDGIHFSPEGYRILAGLLRVQL